ncbi:hypothetical protein BN3456_00805 [Clostridium sp. C105KSO13]|nr:hypothetical protein BN3456_00805 [Clostridium sp. C105KSO13]
MEECNTNRAIHKKMALFHYLDVVLQESLSVSAS